VARQLHLVDALPYADDVHRVHANHQFGDGGVDQLGDSAGTTAVMGFAPSGDAIVRCDFYQHGVAFDGAADAKPDVLSFGNAKRDGNGLDRGNLHDGPHAV
jgi:hypothetical protein